MRLPASIKEVYTSNDEFIDLEVELIAVNMSFKFTVFKDEDNLQQFHKYRMTHPLAAGPCPEVLPATV